MAIEKMVPFSQVTTLSKVNADHDKLKKNREAGANYTAEAGMCVRNTQKILEKSGTGKIIAPRQANHTLSALEDLKNGGWTELKETDPGKAPLGAVVASFAPDASTSKAKRSDLGVITADDKNNRFIGGKPGSKGAYAVKKDKPHESVYAGAKTRIFVPPSVASTA
jgi:hypothetical protein